MEKFRDKLNLIIWILFGCLIGSLLGLALSPDPDGQEVKVKELTINHLYLYDQWMLSGESVNPFEADTVKLLDVQNGYALFEHTKEEVEYYGGYFDTLYTYKQKHSCKVTDFIEHTIKIK